MRIQQNIPLAPFTTLGVGGPAQYFSRVENEAELLEAVELARREELRIFVLGGGSNLVVSDSGVDGLVLQIAIAGPIEVAEEAGLVRYTVPAGTDWDAFVLAVCERGMSGVECLAGIPGLVGGSPVQNIGAYGQEVAETIVSVRVFDLETMRFVSLDATECGFAYRTSIFNSTARGRYIVTSVTFQFDTRRAVTLTYADLQKQFGDAKPIPLEVYHAVRKIRHSKGMLLVAGEADCRSAGSFFKNPIVGEDVFGAIVSRLCMVEAKVPHWPVPPSKVKLAAAWLVEQAGFYKGFAMGRVGISSRHTLALVNLGGATAAELLALRGEIQHRVLERFGVSLEQEPVNLG